MQQALGLWLSNIHDCCTGHNIISNSPAGSPGSIGKAPGSLSAGWLGSGRGISVCWALGLCSGSIIYSAGEKERKKNAYLTFSSGLTSIQEGDRPNRREWLAEKFLETEEKLMVAMLNHKRIIRQTRWPSLPGLLIDKYPILLTI